MGPGNARRAIRTDGVGGALPVTELAVQPSRFPGAFRPNTALLSSTAPISTVFPAWLAFSDGRAQSVTDHSERKQGCARAIEI
jgi:hypothetical protein